MSTDSRPTRLPPTARSGASGATNVGPPNLVPTAMLRAAAPTDTRLTTQRPTATPGASDGASTAATIGVPTAIAEASRRVDRRSAIPDAEATFCPLTATSTHPTNAATMANAGSSGGVDTAATKSTPTADLLASRRPDPRPATPYPTAIGTALGGSTSPTATHRADAIAGPPLGHQPPGQPTKERATASGSPLANPVLVFAADVLDDLETVAVAQANRLRQMTRTEVDKDGITRGLGFDESHPDVAKMAALVAILHCGPTRTRPRKLADGSTLPCCLLHEAERNLERQLKRHPLFGWVQSVRGVGAKQAARLLAALGDPYVRPEWTRSYPVTVEDAVALVELRGFGAGNRVEAKGVDDEDALVRLAEEVERRTGGTANVGGSRGSYELTLTMPEGPRSLRALYAYAGMHIVPISDQGCIDGQGVHVADRHGGELTGDQTPRASQPASVAGAVGGDTSQYVNDSHCVFAGVAPARTRGRQGNWAETVRKRLWLVAESCRRQIVDPCVGKLKSEDGLARHVDGCACSVYRVLYDQSRQRYANAVHRVPCPRCGPKGKPAPPGSPLSDGHQDARAQRIVMRAVLADLWRAAKQHHEGGAP